MNVLFGKNGSRVLIVLFIAQILNYIDKSSINFAVVPISKELSIPSSQIGLILSAYFLSYAIMQFIGGFLADKYGVRKVLTGTVAVWSVATSLTGVARSYFSLIGSRFLVGVGEGAYVPSASVAVADNFHREARARAKSIISSGSSVGFAVGAIIVTFMITTFGWKWMFFLLGFIGIFVSVAVWFVLRPSEEKEHSEKEKIVKKGLIKTSLKNPLVWKLMAAAFFTNIVFWGLQSWLPSYWLKVRHMSMVSTGIYSAIPAIVGFFAFIMSGWILDKKFMDGREKYMFIVGGFLSAIFIYLMFHTQSIPLAFTYLTLSNVFLNGMNLTVFAVPLKYISDDSIGTTTGTINFGAQIGSILTPTIFGYLLSTFNQNFNVGFSFLIASAIVVILVGFTIKTKRKVDDQLPLQQNV